MKNQSFFIWDSKYHKNEQGFILPYVIFMILFIFIVITASLNNYRQEVQITYRQIDQVRIETLVQMGLVKFKAEHIPHQPEKIIVDYTFPDGDVTITSHIINDLEYHLMLSVTTVNHSVSTLLHTIKIPDQTETTVNVNKFQQSD